MPGKRNKYSAQFKLLVIRFAEDSNNYAVKREYCCMFNIGFSFHIHILFDSAATCP